MNIIMFYWSLLFIIILQLFELSLVVSIVSTYTQTDLAEVDEAADEAQSSPRVLIDQDTSWVLTLDTLTLTYFRLVD